MPVRSPRDIALRRVVAAARAIVTYQIGFPIGVTRLSRVLYQLSPHMVLPAPPVADYLRETTDLPVGSERLEATREALCRFDVRLEALNREYRDPVFELCYDIIDQYGTQVGPAPEVDTRQM